MKKEFLKGLVLFIGIYSTPLLAAAPVKAQEKNALVLAPPSISKDICNPPSQRNEALAGRNPETLSEEERLELAQLYYSGGVNTPRDYMKAASTLEALLKNTKNLKIRNKALLQKSRMLARGHGYPQNYHEAIRLLESNEAVDEEDAILELARIHYANGDVKEAARFFQKAAAFNNPRASLSLAYLYQRGKIEGGKNKAQHFFMLAQNQFLQKIASGDCSYVGKMAEIYERIGTLENNQAIAARWYMEAAKLDDVEAKLKLIEYIEQGFLAKREGLPAVQTLLEEAAALGSEEALLRLGALYLRSGSKENDNKKQRSALKMLEKAAARGEYESIKLLVEAYDGRLGSLRNREKLLFWLDKAAQHEEADNDMLMRYARVLGEDAEHAQDQRIFALYQKAARKEDAEALYNLGEAYRFGIGVEQAPTRALRYYRLAAQNGYSSAFRRLEQAYSCGIGKKIDLEKAKIWRERGAFLGAADTYENMEAEITAAQDPKALADQYIPDVRHIARHKDSQKTMVFLALLYQVSGDMENAGKWREQAFDKDKRSGGRYSGHYAYGKALLESPMIAHDEKKALEYISLAARRGHDSALKKLGDIENKKGNISEAVKFYEQAITNGHKDAPVSLARVLKKGRDPERAEKLLTHAAENGDIAAMIELAKMEISRSPYWFKQVLDNYPCDDDDIMFIVKSYSKGENGAPLDIAKAMEWFDRLVGDSNKEPEKLYKLSMVLLKAGNGNSADDTPRKNRAVNFLQEAHESGYLPATQKLAEFYMNGEYVSRDTDRALAMYNKAAESGDVSAMYELGKTYLTGHLIEVSPEKARYWLTKAADGGHAMAAEMLQAME